MTYREGPPSIWSSNSMSSMTCPAFTPFIPESIENQFESNDFKIDIVIAENKHFKISNNIIRAMQSTIIMFNIDYPI